jgi:hypothetical protein
VCKQRCPIEARPGFAALLDRLESNGVRTVVVEDAARFARDLVAQELGVLLLIKRDVRVLTASGDNLTDTSDPSRVMRQIAGSFAQYEKTRLVTELRGARERLREANGKCEGRKSFAGRDPGLVLAAKRLHRRSPKGHWRSLREIARELHAMGYSNKQGRPYSASCIKSMVEGLTPSDWDGSQTYRECVTSSSCLPQKHYFLRRKASWSHLGSSELPAAKLVATAVVLGSPKELPPSGCGGAEPAVREPTTNVLACVQAKLAVGPPKRAVDRRSL